MGADAIAALGQAAGDATFDRTVDMATVMLTEPDLRDRLRERIEAEISDDTRVLVAHSLGTVLSYAALVQHDDWPVHTFVTLGSPLAVPLVFNGLEPAPVDGRGVWPGSVQRWVNVRAVGDKACGPLARRPVRSPGRGGRHRQRAPSPRPRALPELLADRRRDRRGTAQLGFALGIGRVGVCHLRLVVRARRALYELESFGCHAVQAPAVVPGGHGNAHHDPQHQAGRR